MLHLHLLGGRCKLVTAAVEVVDIPGHRVDTRLGLLDPIIPIPSTVRAGRGRL